MSYLFDTDHISILQQQTGSEFAAIPAHIALHPPSELAFSIISLHEQTLGCHAYINQARTADGAIRGYRMLNQVLTAFAAAPVLPFDAAVAGVFEYVDDGPSSIKEYLIRLGAGLPHDAHH